MKEINEFNRDYSIILNSGYPIPMRKPKNIFALLIVSLFIFSPVSFAGKKSKTETPSVFFENLKDGQVIPGDYVVKFGLKGMKVHPAGEVKEHTGHHHIIINGGPIVEDQIVPATETSIHFGKGQTETKLDLKPGKYTLTLQFADGIHKSYGEKLSATVNVTVK